MSSRKHHTKHDRISGGYKRRLKKRGLSRSPKMTPLNTLRRAAGLPAYPGEV